MRILAVDDDPIALAIVQEFAEKAGFSDMQVALSAGEALQMLTGDEQHFDCFLLDIRMPEMDGIELCAEIRAIPRYENTPIVMLTTARDKSSIDRAFLAGAMDYVLKPFEFTELKARLGVFEQLVRKDTEIAAQKHKSNQVNRSRFTFSDPVTLVDAPRTISKMAMENYLLTLSWRNLLRIRVTAFVIAEFDEFFSRTENEDVYYLLCEIAHAMSESFKTSSHLQAYYGYGEFVVVTGKSELPRIEEIGFEIQDRLDQLGLEFESGDTCGLHVLPGQTVAPKPWSKLNPLETVTSALISVEQKRLDWRFSHMPGTSDWSEPLMKEAV